MKHNSKLRKIITVLVVMIMTLTAMLALTGCGDKQDKKVDKKTEKDEINLFVAASLTDSINEIAEAFEKENPDVKVVVNADSSGKLKTQIQEGFDCDIFFSAATNQVDELIEDGLIASKDDTKIVLENQLAVIGYKDYKGDIKDLKELKDAESLAIPYGSVPAGFYTRKALIADGIISANADDKQTVVEIPGSEISNALGGVTVSEQNNVSTVISAVAEKSAQLGLAYSSDVKRNENTKIVFKVSKDLTGDISYPIALIKAKDDVEKNHKANVEKLYKFLQSDNSKKVYEKYGFTAV